MRRCGAGVTSGVGALVASVALLGLASRSKRPGAMGERNE